MLRRMTGEPSKRLLHFAARLLWPRATRGKRSVAGSMNVRQHFFFLSAGVWGLLALAPLASSAGSFTRDLDALVEQALATSPLVAEARHRLEQERARLGGTSGFFDPAVVATAGRGERVRGVPGMSSVSAVGRDATAFEAGVALPVRPGFYFGLGAAERFLAEPGGDHGHLYQTLVGVQLEVPLLRDRGFREWHDLRLQTAAELATATAHLLDVTQRLRRDVAQAFIGVYEAAATYRVAHEATARFQALLSEAEELVRLKVVPEYQIHPARMEQELRREEELQAQQNQELSALQLEKTVGRPLPGDADDTMLVSWAAELQLPEQRPVSRAIRFRGDCLQIRHERDLANAQLAAARERMRADVSVNVSATWQGEDPHGPFGGGRALAGEHVGGQVSLVWRQRVRQRAERADVRRYRERVAELEAQLAELALRVKLELAKAGIEFRTARARLKLTDVAAAAARQTLQAEQERFRLGDGRSRYVLDAQKDLTIALQRQTRIAAALLRAYSDARHASGYSLTTSVLTPGQDQD